jgi:hypothetical protein
LEDQVPPGVVLERVVVPPANRVRVPVVAATVGTSFTVITSCWLALQPFALVTV